MERGNIVCVPEMKKDDQEQILLVKKMVSDAPYILIDEIVPIIEETTEERLKFEAEKLDYYKQEIIKLEEEIYGKIDEDVFKARKKGNSKARSKKSAQAAPPTYSKTSSKKSAPPAFSKKSAPPPLSKTAAPATF